LTRHRRSKHPEGEEVTSKATKKAFIPAVDSALLERFFTEIVEKLRDEKLCPEAILTAITNVKPSEEFLAFIKTIFGKFCRKQNQDVLLANFCKEIYMKWKTFLPSCSNQKAINLLLIHLPQKLVGYYKDAASSGIEEVSI
jgi:hypothetical protein